MPEELIEFYEIQNTVSERDHTISARWSTLGQAKEDLHNYSDWWRPTGTGTIYCVQIKTTASGKVTINRKKVYER